jgi:hypothetical protein
MQRRLQRALQHRMKSERVRLAGDVAEVKSKRTRSIGML